MIKKTIIGLLVLFLLSMPVACAKETTPVPTPTPAPAPGLEPASGTPPRTYNEMIEPNASTDKDSYITGENVVIEISLKNVNPYEIEIDPFPPITEIEHRKHSQEDKPVRSFPSGNERRSLEAGEVATYALTWDQRDDNGQLVDYGYYTFRIRTSSGGYGFDGVLVQPPAGVIERTIEVNESQTVNGITVTLKRVELSFEEAKFYVSSKRPAGYLPSRHSAAAEYQLDNGPIRNAGTGGFDFFEDRIDCLWVQVDPVAKDTKELTFTITRFGDTEGPWEFKIPLE